MATAMGREAAINDCLIINYIARCYFVYEDEDDDVWC